MALSLPFVLFFFKVDDLAWRINQVPHNVSSCYIEVVLVLKLFSVVRNCSFHYSLCSNSCIFGSLRLLGD